MQNRKVLALLVVSVLLASFFTYVFAQSNSTFTISGGVYPGAPSYTVWGESGTYYAKNAYGLIEFSGTDTATVTQAALNGLTADRTWKERIVMRGQFPLTVPLTPSNYTILDASAAQFLSRTGLGGFYFIDINGKNNVEVWGGFYTGDASSPVDAVTYPEGIYTSVAVQIRNNSSEIKIVGLKTDHLYGAVNIYGGSQKIMLRDIFMYKNAADIALVPDTADITDVNIIGCISPDGFDDAIALLSETAGHHNISNITISNCHSFKPSNAGGHASVKIFASVGTITGVNINNNIFSNYLGPTIDLRDANVSDIGITGNQLVSPSNQAIYIYNGVKKVRIYGNPLIASSLTGDSQPIVIEHCTDAEIDIIDNYIHGYGIAGFGLINIHDSTYIDILMNRIKGLDVANTRGISMDGTSDYVRVEENRIQNVPYPLMYVGANNRIKQNVGFVTENSVTTINTTATTFVFNHGLASIATNVQCSFNFTGWTSWAWTSTSTQVTVTVAGTLPASMTCYAKVEYLP